MKKDKKVDEKSRKKINNKLFGILYLVCALCCIFSGIINYNFETNKIYIVDLILALAWIIFSVIYFRKAIKEKKSKK